MKKCAPNCCKDNVEFLYKEIEKHFKAKLIRNHVMVMHHEFYNWLSDICGDVQKKCLITYKKPYYKVQLCTDTHIYFLAIRLPTKNCIDGYMGAAYSKRSPRVGEFWTRGCDLPDGKYHILTWNRIANSILKNEILSLELDG